MSTHDERHDHDFDQAMRRLHTQAVEQLSPATRARLRVARQTAASGARESRRGFGWVLASGGAAALALVIAMQLQPRPASPPTTAAAPGIVAITPDAGSLYDADTAVAALDENPDLYLWLASNSDALPAAAEH